MRTAWIITVWLTWIVLAITPPVFGADPTGHADMLWQSAAREQARIEASRPLMQDANLKAYLDGVVRRLWSQTSTNLPPMQLRIIMDSRPQAFTYPNGVCYLTVGMLVSLQFEDQLAMILAHEMAHYVGQHTRRAWDRLQMTFEPAKGVDDTGIPSTRQGGTAAVSSAGFFTAAELEADAQGLEWMQRAGYCPGLAIPLLEKMSLHEADAPRTSQKQANLRLQAAQKHIQAGTAADFCNEQASRTDTYNRGIASALLADIRLVLQHGQWNQARKQLARYGGICPLDAEALFLRGELLRRDPQNAPETEAIRAYQSAIRLDPDFAPAYRALGMLHFKLGRKESARRYFESYLAKAPDSPDRLFIKDYVSRCAN